MMKRILLLILLVLPGLSYLKAQTTCTEQLKLTQRSFDDGLLDDIPLLLADCMKNGFTKEEKANAYKLLIQTYLFSEQYQKADEVMIQFLNEFPSYAIATNDPKEFVNLHSTYRTKPIFKVEFLGGANFCQPIVVQSYGVSNIRKVHPNYKSKLGYTFELNYIDNLYKNIGFSVGSSVTISNLDYLNNPYDFSTVTAVIKNTYIGLPMSIRYNYKFKGINLFGKLGIEPNFLLISSIDLTRVDDRAGIEPYSGTENLLRFHKKFDARPFLAIGTAFNIGRDQMGFSAGFKFSTSSLLNMDKLYSDTYLANKYFYVEDNILMSQAYVAVSYIRSIYKPKKIK